MVPDGQRVRTHREKRGWTQEDLASNSDTTERTVQRIEANKSVSIDSLRLVASALGVDFCDLLPPEDPPPEPVSTQEQDAEFKGRYEKRRQLLNTVAKLGKYWQDHVPGCCLIDKEKKKFEKWLRDYSVPEILTAMDECIQQYVELSANGLCTADSAELAFSKIPAVSNVNRREPEERELYFIRGFVRKRMSHFDDREGIYLLRCAHNAGASIEKLRVFASAARNWDEFKEGLEILSRAPAAEISTLPRAFQEPAPGVIRTLPAGGARAICESVAIVAATKRLTAGPTELATEILQKASNYGELVITIDFDRGLYYLGRSRDGDGRMFGIHQPWTVRELADAIRNKFDFLP
jgi:transcriptional regulator with XRE-family HTH domain